MKLTHAAQTIAILALMAISGCSSGDQVVATDKHEYIALENNTIQRFNVIQVTIPAAGGAPDQLATNLVHVGDVTATQVRLTKVIKDSPPWLQLEPGDQNLLDYVDEAAKEQPPGRIRWILSVNPVIVGIGTETEDNPRDTLGAEFSQGTVELQGDDRLVTRQDLHRTIDAICFLDAWNNADNPTIRVFPLGEHPSILVVLRSRPWLTAPTAAPMP